jgi:hypothetical protein
MPRDDDAASHQVKTTIPLVRGGVAEEDTNCGAWSELVFYLGGEVRIPKRTEST